MFLRAGDIRPSLNSWGNIPDSKDEFMIVVMTDRTVSRHAFRILVGSGSSAAQDLDGGLTIMLCTVSIERF